MSVPINFPWPSEDPSNTRAGMQGQNFQVLMEDSGPLSKVRIRMRPGKVSTVHAHERAHVYVDVLQAEGQGALTLAGFNLEHEIWTPANTTLHLPPEVPHVAVYPRPDGPTIWGSADLVAIETRCHPIADADIVVLAGYEVRLYERLRQLDLLDRVDLALP